VIVTKKASHYQAIRGRGRKVNKAVAGEDRIKARSLFMLVASVRPTTVYRVPMIAGWSAVSGHGPSAFDLIGPGGCLVFVQTPQRIPPLNGMRRPGHEPQYRCSATRRP
jgi:hypothetical protein